MKCNFIVFLLLPVSLSNFLAVNLLLPGQLLETPRLHFQTPQNCISVQFPFHRQLSGYGEDNLVIVVRQWFIYSSRSLIGKKIEAETLITSGNRSEARQWLCTAIAGINSFTSRQQRDLFVKLLEHRPTNRTLASQLVEMVFQKRTDKAGSILAKRSYVLENFFDVMQIYSILWLFILLF